MKHKRKVMFNWVDYYKMLKEISNLVETDFCFDMDCKTMPHSKPFTQKEAKQMAMVIGQIYLIAHSIHCSACQTKYITKPK